MSDDTTRRPWGWAYVHSPLTASVCIGERCPADMQGLPNVKAVFAEERDEAASAATGPDAAAASPTYGIVDPDYARAYSIIRCTAWMYGYAVGLHGSFTRDLDLILVPWTDKAVEPERLIPTLADRTGTTVQHGSPSDKPHGRRAWTLLLPGFAECRWIDVSVMPRIAPTAATVPDGWKWMTHPSRNDGQPIPVRVFTEGGATYYQPWEENGCEYEWDKRDSLWEEVTSHRPAARPQC